MAKATTTTSSTKSTAVILPVEVMDVHPVPYSERMREAQQKLQDWDWI